VNNDEVTTYSAEQLESILYGPYSLEGVIGAGAYSTVYKGTYKNKQVAIKILHPRSEHMANQKYTDMQLTFLRESSTLKKLDHPNIIQLLTAGIHGKDNNQLFYIVMEHGGTSLAKVKGDFNRDNLIDVFFQAAQGLHHAHDKGIIHRDIRKENILYNEEGRIRLVDFGLAKHVNEMSGEKGFTGNFKYAAPEMLFNQNTPSSDLYGLGMIVYELATGQLPFKFKKYNNINEILQSKRKWQQQLSQKRPDISTELQELIEYSFHPNSSERPPLEVVIEELTTMKETS
jgi:eukaryotic-like serine/threonine-protein kinase